MRKKMVFIFSSFILIIVLVNVLVTTLWNDKENYNFITNIKNVINKNFFQDQVKWPFEALISYDDGLMPSIKSETIQALQNHYSFIDWDKMDIKFYYGSINETNFYSAQEINFSKYSQRPLFLFTIGIFGTKKSKIWGADFINVDLRPQLLVQNTNKIMLDDHGQKIDNIASVFTALNELLKNTACNNVFDQQLKAKNIDFSEVDDLQPGQIYLDSSCEKYLQASDFQYQDHQITINHEFLNHLPITEQSSLFALKSSQDLTLKTGNSVNVTSADFKNNKTDYTELSEQYDNQTTLLDLYDILNTAAVAILKKTYNDFITTGIPEDQLKFDIQFRKSYSTELLPLSTKIIDFWTHGPGIHSIWLEFKTSDYSLINMINNPGLHIDLKGDN